LVATAWARRFTNRFFRERLVVNKTIDLRDAHRIVLTDSPCEAFDSISEIAVHRFGLTCASG
jgi:hypothetical protein